MMVVRFLLERGLVMGRMQASHLNVPALYEAYEVVGGFCQYPSREGLPRDDDSGA
jgi:hypothetical protein